MNVNLIKLDLPLLIGLTGHVGLLDVLGWRLIQLWRMHDMRMMVDHYVTGFLFMFLLVRLDTRLNFSFDFTETHCCNCKEKELKVSWIFSLG